MPRNSSVHNPLQSEEEEVQYLNGATSGYGDMVPALVQLINGKFSLLNYG